MNHSAINKSSIITSHPPPLKISKILACHGPITFYFLATTIRIYLYPYGR